MIQPTKYLALITIMLVGIGLLQALIGSDVSDSLTKFGALLILVGFGTHIGFSVSWICEDNKK